ncbi:hypothetical protein B0H65DRAFT_324757 [Neurospora tetraspora]|uniref:FAD-binding PCMH-type domain-containing protein n=1 Tax=Neurospora tetraspora TaxID=94610 RepID=A0AAE0J8K4_9PEZI|nr:hypothetical protein B0H65DRAFT_324757 [Neurospora tetraspora]
MADNDIKTMAEKTIIADLITQGIPTFTPSGPKASEYERSVATANLLYRFTRPACVVQPETREQVAQVIKKAKKLRVPVTIKCGGHSYAGFSTTNEGILLDLVRMNKVDLDVDNNLVTLQGGALWGHAYKALVNGRHNGIIINGGRCPTVGVGGFLLGGGLGPFTRSFGMGCDTLKEATLVTADGRIVTVSDENKANSDEGKLFWALRGAGGGNFGVVVEFKMYLSHLQNEEGLVVAGRYTWFPNPAVEGAMDEFTRTMEQFYTTSWPDSITINSSWLCDLKQQTSSELKLGVRFLVYYDGTKSDFDALISDKVQQKDLAKQLKRRTLAEKSTRFLHETLASQWSEETIKAFPSGTETAHKLYSSFVFKNDASRIKSVISIIRQEMAAFRREFAGESGLLQVTWIHSGGKASAKKRSETAFRWRDCTYHAYIMLEWQEKWLEMDMRGFLQKFKEKLRPFSMMGCAAFINFPDAALQSNASERVYYGNNRQKLQRVKQIWDKDNFFQWNQGVRLPQPEANKTANSMSAKAATFNAKAAPMSLISGEGLLSTSSFGWMSESNSVSPQPSLLNDDGEDGSLGDEGEMVDIDEQMLTDVYASEQWDSFDHPAASGKINYSALGRGIIDLSNLGF